MENLKGKRKRKIGTVPVNPFSHGRITRARSIRVSHDLQDHILKRSNYKRYMINETIYIYICIHACMTYKSEEVGGAAGDVDGGRDGGEGGFEFTAIADMFGTIVDRHASCWHEHINHLSYHSSHN